MPGKVALREGYLQQAKGGPAMGAYQSQHKQHRRDRWEVLQRILLVLIIVCTLGILAIALLVAQGYWGIFTPEQRPTPTPIVVVSPAPTPSPIPSPTPEPTPSLTPTPIPTPSPTPTPTPPPGVLVYPLYSGNTHLPEIALTFDDGPSPAYTSQVLTILQTYGVKATFFVIGTNAAAYPDYVQQEYQQGNAIGNHTWTHPNLTQLSSSEGRSQLQRTSDEIQAVTGVNPTVFRPPGGNFNSSVQSIAASLGLSTVLWNVDPRDWSQPGTDVIIQRVLDAVHNGSIILLHDGGGNRSETVAALPTIISRLEQRGFQFVTIPRLIQDLTPLGAGGVPTTPPELYPEGFFMGGTSPMYLSSLRKSFHLLVRNASTSS